MRGAQQWRRVGKNGTIFLPLARDAHVSASTLAALCGLALALGARHGLDADHLATIDGLTRANRAKPALARAAGSLFSLGHGTVVLLVALAAAGTARHWHTPQWLDGIGATVSLAFLFGLAFLNVRAVAATAPGDVVALGGLRSRVLLRIPVIGHPLGVAAVGALFAVSFDTVSQAALFALAADRFGGLAGAATAAGCFLVGMTVVDGLNGWWIARLVRAADRRAARVSRAMALTVAAVAAAIGIGGLARLASPGIDAWMDDHAFLMAGAIIAAVPSALLGSLWRVRRSEGRLAVR
jgi:high-affinity nickel-transport protein